MAHISSDIIIGKGNLAGKAGYADTDVIKKCGIALRDIQKGVNMQYPIIFIIGYSLPGQIHT